MIFLDTSAIFALADIDDEKHSEAVRLFESVQDTGEQILTRSYILVESAALLQHRIGLDAALAFLREACNFTVLWVDESLHDRAVQLLNQRKPTKISLVDAVNVVVMQEKGIKKFLSFDKHFSDAGHQPYA
jgi:uncharacterized protein